MTIIYRTNVLVDVDHVISDAFWRDPMIGVVPWDEYHAASKDDKPIHDIVHLLRAIDKSRMFNIVGFTARPEKWRVLTMGKLLSFECPMHELLMRPDENFRPAPELKLELARSRFGNQTMPEHIAFILDDREDVIVAFKDLGITALQVHARRNN